MDGFAARKNIILGFSGSAIARSICAPAIERPDVAQIPTKRITGRL